ncbi:MAG TPA: antibiotic biosynthesis monooxygenase [Candidatus Saccharimonadales bacterium]|nr:antibiotic biosynthesis monooxygenase [Candidatus Saccharimonadales bacterium]
MVAKIVRYKAKPHEVTEVAQAIKDFLVAIAKHEPDTDYQALQMTDGVSFIHTMRFKDEAAMQKHANADYTLKFTDVLYPRCEVEPEFSDVKDVFSTESD